ncbi:hydrogenase maturation protease [Microbulbifer yueqingensis]|uniref:Hydrogenase maturation protease n=1 Tax=Microbulbifer yueqingensis TaxID=658219 RepID=A0A1G8ZT01_9GAMM|nr:hydrogenase maturation protease [Microbulbifer yueqingensis]SDK18131.1 hydrogenase maturation protease [Microbulbifer yueqingensis]
MSGWTIISLGSRFRGDDGVGPYVLDRLRGRFAGRVPLVENGGDMPRLLQDWSGRWVCLVDAVIAEGHAVGDIIRLDGLVEAVAPSPCTTSSHGLNLAEALEMGKVVGALPARLEIFAVCGADFTTGTALSRAVKSAAASVEMEILELLATPHGGPECTNTP